MGQKRWERWEQEMMRESGQEGEAAMASRSGRKGSHGSREGEGKRDSKWGNQLGLRVLALEKTPFFLQGERLSVENQKTI